LAALSSKVPSRARGIPASLEPGPRASSFSTASDVDRLEAAADEAVAACGGDVRDALKAPIVEFLENEVCKLMHAVSHAYVRGRFKTYTGRHSIG
jgi:hypothetical protein